VLSDLVVIVVVGLKYGCLIPHPSANSIVSAHDFSQLIEIAKYMNPNSPVEPCGLEQPEILVIVAALSYFIRGLHGLLFC